MGRARLGQEAASGRRRGNGQGSPCIDGKPHCFSTTPERYADDELFLADYGETSDWLVEAPRYTKPFREALADMREAISSYPPGQSGVDGGGFKLVTEQQVGPYVCMYA